MFFQLPDDIMVQIVLPIVGKQMFSTLTLVSKDTRVSFLSQIKRISAAITPKPDYADPHTNTEYLAVLVHRSQNKKYLNKSLQRHIAFVGLFVRNFAIVRDFASYIKKYGDIVNAITLPRNRYIYGAINRNYTPPISGNITANLQNTIAIIDLLRDNITDSVKRMGMFQVMRDVLVHQSAKIKLNTEPVAELAIRTLFAHFDEEIAQEFIDKYVPSGQLKVIAPQAVRYEKKNIYLKYKGHMRGYSRIYHNLDYVETYRGIAHIVNDRIIRDNYWVVNGVVSDNHPLDVIKKIGCEYTDLFNLREIHSDLSHYHMIVYNMIPVINPNNYNRVCDAIKKTYNVEPYLLICAESSEFYDAFFATIEARKATLRKQGIIPTI